MSWLEYHSKTAHRAPRRTLCRALDLFEAEPAPSAASTTHSSALELGCGGGRDTVEMLRRGWSVLAIDSEPTAIDYLLRRSDLTHRERLTTECARFEAIPLPTSRLICSSFALPLCPPPSFFQLWSRIGDALLPGGRFAGHFFGERDSWNHGHAPHQGLTFVSADQAHDLLAPYQIEMFEEEESDSTTPRGESKHWHVMHIVAQKR
ncbi:MAG: methyltransferase domain-containing protein [Hyphomicrobiales bacterium]|nr:methyltransferase domain-containing protein [Hyphomicrobiales bacterium]